ncbi:MAG: CopG family ribbon-helix-helix protein [Acidimicrobiales bacterium]
MNVKVAVSIPNELYGEADRIAAREGLNRSELYARALRQYVDDHESDELTRKIDETCETDAEDLAPVVRADLIDAGTWGW